MKLQQLSVFCENRPGHLLEPVRLLARASIDLRALTLADTRQFGILRLIVRDWRKARELLEASGAVVQVTEVIAAEVPDRPGGLASVLALLENSGINIEYMCAFPYVRGERAVLIFHFDDNGQAICRLTEGGVRVLERSELDGF
jgi:hypothetical protein